MLKATQWRRAVLKRLGLKLRMESDNAGEPMLNRIHDFLKSSATEFMQYRSPVGRGPSSNTCPRWASHLAQRTSVRSIPSDISARLTTFSFAIGCQKLGQPVPDSNLVSE